MRFSLQDMVRNTLAEAEEREKIAQLQESESEKSKKQEKQEYSDKVSTTKETGNTPERNYDSCGEKTSSVYVEKLASAVGYLNSYFLKTAVGEPEPSPSHKNPTAVTGAGIGATALETNMNSPTTGMQSEEFGEAKTGKPPLTPGQDSKSPGQTNPATALETNLSSPPGGNEDWTHQDKLKQSSVQKKYAQLQRVMGIMSKMAEGAEDPSDSEHVSATRKDVPPSATKSEEGVPPLPGTASKQSKMVTNSNAAINYTKQDAKAVPKAQMGEVIDEPAQKKSTDPVLQQNLDAASSAGVKISSLEKSAAARAFLRKIAEEGAKEDASPEEKERAAKLQEALKVKQEEKKEANFGRTMPLSGGY